MASPPVGHRQEQGRGQALPGWPHTDTPKTSSDYPPPHIPLTSLVRASRLPRATWLLGAGCVGQARPGEGSSGHVAPTPPTWGRQAVPAWFFLNALVFLCVLVTLETNTVDSVATGIVSSHTELWGIECRAQPGSACLPVGAPGKLRRSFI